MASYEFGGQHEVEFGKAGYWMAQVGVLGMFVGGLQALSGLLSIGDEAGSAEGLAGVLAGAIYFVFGLLLRRSGKAFSAIATSDGKDLDHLLVAVVSLKQLFRIMVVGIALLVLLALGGGMLVGFMAGEGG